MPKSSKTKSKKDKVNLNEIRRDKTLGLNLDENETKILNSIKSRIKNFTPANSNYRPSEHSSKVGAPPKKAAIAIFRSPDFITLLSTWSKGRRNDDSNLLKVIIAEKWVEQDAWACLIETVIWRQYNRVDEMMTDEKRIGTLTKFMQLGSLYIHTAKDRDGRPVIVHRKKPGKETDKIEEVMTAIYMLEKARMSMPRTGRALEWIWITDLDPMKFGNVASKDILMVYIYIMSRHYGESLRRAYVVNAPGVFSFVWKIIAAFLEPNTLDRVQIISDIKDKDSKASFLELFEPSQVPDVLGGPCRCRFNLQEEKQWRGQFLESEAKYASEQAQLQAEARQALDTEASGAATDITEGSEDAVAAEKAAEEEHGNVEQAKEKEIDIGRGEENTDDQKNKGAKKTATAGTDILVTDSDSDSSVGADSPATFKATPEVTLLPNSHSNDSHNHMNNPEQHLQSEGSEIIIPSSVAAKYKKKSKKSQKTNSKSSKESSALSSKKKKKKSKSIASNSSSIPSSSSKSSSSASSSSAAAAAAEVLESQPFPSSRTASPKKKKKQSRISSKSINSSSSSSSSHRNPNSSKKDKKNKQKHKQKRHRRSSRDKDKNKNQPESPPTRPTREGEFRGREEEEEDLDQHESSDLSAAPPLSGSSPVSSNSLQLPDIQLPDLTLDLPDPARVASQFKAWVEEMGQSISQQVEKVSISVSSSPTEDHGDPDNPDRPSTEHETVTETIHNNINNNSDNTGNASRQSQDDVSSYVSPSAAMAGAVSNADSPHNSTGMNSKVEVIIHTHVHSNLNDKSTEQLQPEPIASSSRTGNDMNIANESDAKHSEDTSQEDQDNSASSRIDSGDSDHDRATDEGPQGENKPEECIMQ